jgi:hypothetical protein
VYAVGIFAHNKSISTMKKSVYFLFSALFLFPAAAICSTSHPTPQTQPKIGLKEKIRLAFTLKKMQKKQEKQLECDTIFLKDGSAIYADVVRKTSTDFKIKPCDEPDARYRTLNRDLVKEIRYGDVSPDGKSRSSSMNVVGFACGLLSLLFVLISFNAEALLWLFLSAPLLAIFAVVYGVLGFKKPKKGLGILGIIFGLLALLAFAAVAT